MNMIDSEFASLREKQKNNFTTNYKFTIVHIQLIQNQDGIIIFEI